MEDRSYPRKGGVCNRYICHQRTIVRNQITAQQEPGRLGQLSLGGEYDLVKVGGPLRSG